MHRLYVILYGTPGSYLRNALHEGGEYLVARLVSPRAKALLCLTFILLCC
jgi:hypothetical protein